MLFLSPYRVFAFVLLVSVFCFTTTAAVLDDAALQALSQIPPCALQCINQNLPAIGCTLIDIECQCSSKNSTKILQPCLQEQCSYDETFATLRAQASICDRPHDDRATSIRIVAYVTGIIPIIVIAMRFASRYVGGNKFWWDDWLHLAAVILVIPLTALLILNLKEGLGHHIWDLTYPRIVAIGKWTYITTLIWGVELLLIKYSILCLYIRIFPNVWLKRAVYAFMAFTALFTLPLLFLAAFQCIPVRAIWNLSEQGTAKCIDYIAVLKLTVVYEIIAETILFALPIPIVWKLHMKTAKKIELLVFFSLGICVIVMSAVRLPFLPGVVDTTDPTYTVTGTSITGFTTSAVSHVCAAVPTTRNFVRYCRNGFKMPTESSSGYVPNLSTYKSTSRRSYKSLEGNGDGFVTIQQPGKALCRDTKDPYRLSAILDAEDDSGVVELHAIDSLAHAGVLNDEERGRQRGASGRTRRDEDQLPTIARESPSPGFDDSASQNSILYRHSYI